MDALSDVLRVVGLTGGVFLDARFTAPWCILGKVDPQYCKPFMAPPEHVMCFHYVTKGECLVEVDGEEPREVRAGDVVLVPRNTLHKMGSRLDLETAPPFHATLPTGGVGVPRVDYGGGGEPCEMVCGFLGGDAQLEPLIGALPAIMTMTLADTPGGDWIAQSFRFGAQQLAQGDPGAATIMSKMSELLFVEAVRRYLRAMPEERTGFLAGLRDAAVGKALALMHSQVAREWTVDELAQAVSMSRSVFAERFAALIGQPPVRYLTSWRMQLAAHKLREGRQSIPQIAFDIGYESEAAFARAFKREVGIPPATWRKRAVDGTLAAKAN
jgi:AraC-like DNA-binding protein